MNFGEHFEWDDAKAAANLAKHGVAFVEAVAAFADPRRVILPDLDTAAANHAGIAWAGWAMLS